MKKTQLFKRVSEILSICIFLSGSVVLIGWIFDIPVLKSISPNFVAMKANTAICFIFIGLSLWLLQTKWQDNGFARGIARLCAFVVFLIGFLTFWEYMLEWDFGIDQLLFKESATAILTHSPGMMAFNTSIIFVIISIALFMVGFETVLFSYLAQLLVIPAGILALLSFVGYLYGASPLYIGLKFSTAMALHTCVLFIMSCIGCLFARPEQGLMKNISSDNYGGLMLRRILPAVIVIPLVLGWFKIHGEKTGWFGNEFGVSFVATFNLTAFSLFVYMLSAHLNRLDVKRRQTEYVAGVSELRYRRLFETAQDGILLIDFETGMILDANQFLIDLLGYSKADFLKKYLWEVGVFKDVAASKDNFLTLQRKRFVRFEDLPLETKTGKKIDVEFIANAYQVDEETIIQCNIRDITDRKKMQEELREWSLSLEQKVSERTKEIKSAQEATLNLLEDLEAAKTSLEVSKASFHNIVEKSIDGIVVVDNAGILQFVNPMAETSLGHHAKELVGQLFGFSLKADQITEIDIIRHNKEPGIAEMRVVETRWNDRPAWLALLRDVTERKETEEKLKETMKIKSEFTSMVSHELRTPLTAIKEGIALVLDSVVGDINDEQKELLGIAKKNVDRLARLIGNVLDFQKLEAGMMKLNIVPNDINKIAKDVYETMISTVKESGIDMVLDINDNLPIVRFDSDKITQVLINLVSNAVKFTEQGNITIKTSRGDDSINVSVIDTGCGIREEDLPRVFNKFEQLNVGGERKTGGTGLGLAIARNIIERHKGKIRIESTYGKGSKFTFTLPKQQQKETAENRMEREIPNPNI